MGVPGRRGLRDRKSGVDGESMPIVEQINRVLFEDKNPAEAVKELMLRDARMESTELYWK